MVSPVPLLVIYIFSLLEVRQFINLFRESALCFVDFSVLNFIDICSYLNLDD